MPLTVAMSTTLRVLILSSVLQAATSQDVPRAVVFQEEWAPEIGGYLEVEVTRPSSLCCVSWDWVGLQYADGTRATFALSGDDTYATFVARVNLTGGDGNYELVYSTSMDNWTMHDLHITRTYAANAPTAVVVGEEWAPEWGGVGYLEVAGTRPSSLCCVSWDWVGLQYANGTRVSFVHSGADTDATFVARLNLTGRVGTYELVYSTSRDNWAMHDLHITRTYAANALSAMSNITPEAGMDATTSQVVFP